MGNWKEKFKAILSVYLILQQDDGKILLLLRQNTGYCDGEYGLPAGHVDGGETLHRAMVREAQEEVGINIDQKNLELVHTMHRYCGDHERVDYFFLCKKWRGDIINTEPNKCEELSWHSLEFLPNNLIDYYQQMFKEWQKGEPLSYFGWN